MLAKTALLVVSNPTQIGKALSSIEKHVKKTLYIQLLSALSCQGGFHSNVFNTWPKFSQAIYGIYCQAASQCRNIDVRVLLSGIKYNKFNIETHRPIDLVIFDKVYPQNEVDSFVNQRISNVAKDYNVITLETDEYKCNLEAMVNEKVCDHVVLGGTFDRLHIAHKLLLSEGLLRARKKLTVGVTEENMLHSKILWELIEDTNTRIYNVKDFVSDICPEVETDIVPICDPFGPAVVDPTMELIVVSAETVKGGEKINEIRESKGLNKLEVLPLDLVEDPFRQGIEESKISSSTGRLRLLGTLLKPVIPNKNIPLRPYIIGLTGAIASGKSGVAKKLLELGAEVINCDLVAHKVYEPGKPCYRKVVEHFGDRIVCSTGEIDRKVLGSIVFGNPEEMQKLNSLVWPAIMDDVRETISNCNKEVVVLEAAVLLQAEWDKYCHEVWTTVVPRDETILRLTIRNGFTEEQAISRINAQPSNIIYVKAAHVVLCPLWEYEYTGQQVQKAWDLLQNRIHKLERNNSNKKSIDVVQ